MARSGWSVAWYQVAWATVTRTVLGTGVGILAACFVILLPWLSAVALLGLWAGRRRLSRPATDWAAVAADNEGLGLLGVGLVACLGWTLLLGPAGAGLVLVTLTGAGPVLAARQREVDLRSAWWVSDQALQTAPSPDARLWLVRQRASYLDDLERRDPERFAELTQELTRRD